MIKFYIHFTVILSKMVYRIIINCFSLELTDRRISNAILISRLPYPRTQAETQNETKNRINLSFKIHVKIIKFLEVFINGIFMTLMFNSIYSVLG